MPKKQTTVDFSEIFYFAESHSGLQWNECCDIFHRNSEVISSPETRNKTVYLEDRKAELEWLSENKDSKYYKESEVKLNEVLIAFMEEEGLEEMMVINK